MFNLGKQAQTFAEPTQTNQFADQTNQAFNQNQPQLDSPLTPNKGLFQIPERYLQLIPLLPLVLEMLTGQKIPAMGAMADILSGVQQLQFTQQQLQASQQQLWNKLNSLENNASNQFNNLTQQVNSFKVLVTETRKSLEFNSQPRIQPRNELETEPNYEN